MPAFRVSGTTGQAATTSFFGAIPDKFNFILPAHFKVGNQPVDILVTCNLVNQMTPWNQSYGGGPNVATGTFGAFTTAPDGTTNTAQLFVEATSNSVHLLQAGSANTLTAQTFTGIAVRELGTLTLSGFFKYSGRRITMLMSGTIGSTAGNGDPVPIGGVQATFDLANGVIGVAAALTGLAVGSYSQPSASIVSFGNGWYRCSVTAVINHSFHTSQGSMVYGSVFLDNGTGSAAASTSYTGDGVSGVYGWRINLMPTDSYAMPGQTIFFDDFLSSSTIDLGNTLAPGFNWYLQHSTVFRLSAPNTPFPPTSPGILTVSGSVLSIAPAGTGTTELDSCAALSIALNAPTVGTTYTIPGLFETRMNWDYNLSNGASANPSFWAEAMPFMVGQPFSFNTNPTQAKLSLPGKEYDFMEGITLGGGLFPGNTYFLYDPATERNGNECTKTNNAYGFAKWQSVITYNTGNFGVFDPGDSNYYLVLGANVNTPPHTSIGVKWTAYSPPPTPVNVFYEDFHVYSAMYLPWKRGSFGLILLWLDGVPVGIASYAPVNNIDNLTGVTGNRTGHAPDGQPFRINVQGCGQTCTTRYDWVRVTQ